MKWTSKHQHFVEQYLAATTKEEKDIYYSKLFPAIDNIIITASSSLPYTYFIEEDELNFSKVREYIYTRVMTKIEQDKAATAKGLIFISAKNYMLTLINHNKMKRKLDIDTNVCLSTIDYAYDESIDYDDIKDQILQALADKIELAKKRRKKKDILFLLLIRQYLIDNQYDERGTAEYVCRMMRIKVTTFSKIMNRYDIAVGLFLKPKSND